MINFFQTCLLSQKIHTPHNNFNVIRLILALLVVYFHAYGSSSNADPLTQLLAPSLNLGEFAVGIFFFLSGLFVMHSWLAKRQIISFLIKRIARMLPGLIICVLTTTVVAVIFFSTQGYQGLGEGITWTYILNNSFIFFLQGSVFQSSLKIPGVFSYLPESTINGPLWTLIWEGRFYIALAILGMSAVTTSKYWFTAIGAIVLIYIGFDTDTILLKLKYSLWEYKLLALFISGMIVCTLANFITVRTSLLFGLVLYVYLNHQGSGAVGIYLLGCAFALWFGTLEQSCLPFFRTHDYSYSVYIYHFPIMQMLRKSPILSADHFLLLASTLFVLIPICALSWKYIEKPSIRFAKKLTQNISW